MRAIRKFSLTLAASAILLLLAVALTSVGANSRLTQSSAPKPSATAAMAKTIKTYTMSSGLWRTDGSFVSTIRIKNILVVAPLDVTPLLFMADGTPYMLPSVHVPVSGVATVSVNDVLASAPQSIAGHVSQFGSVSLIWSYSSPGHLSAQVAAIDASRSLSYTYPFMVPIGMPGHDSKQVLEGLWWKRDSGVTGFVTLSNTTDQQQTAILTPVHPGNSAGSQQISLAPHSTQMLNLEALGASVSTPDNRAGGIRVEYQGQQGAILVNGGLTNESEGYSANIPFSFHDTSSAPSTMITLASAGLMVGKPDPMMMPGFPKDTMFSPYLALRNATEKPLDVALQVNYMTGMGAEGSMPVTKNLPALHLAPFEARQLDLHGPLTAAGLKSFSGSINLSASFTGKTGDLVLATGSADQTGTYVFEVEPQGAGSSRSKYSNYWGVTNGNDTMYSLWNPTDTPQDIAATFYYGDGSGKYVLPIRLEPQTSTMIDMAMLIMENKPDANGNLIPSSVQEGSAEFSSAKDRREMITVVIASGIYNVTTATCGGGCITCCGITEQPGSNPQVYPNPFSCTDGGSVTLNGSAEDCAGYYYYPDTNGWTSSNTSVATVDSVGNVTCVGAGSVNISASWSNLVVATGQICGPPSCPTGNFGAPASGTIKPSLQLTLGNQYSSIFVGTDTNLTTPNTLFATVNPSGGSFTETSSNSGDTFAQQSTGTWVITTTTQSSATGDRTLTVTYTVNGQQASQSLHVTARQFAYATNNSPSNTCTLGYGTKYLYNYTPYTHPDHEAVQPGIGLSGTAVTESFNPQPPAGTVTGSGGLDANSQFQDAIAYCSTSPLTLSTSVTQSISIEGYQVRQNLLTYSSSGVSLTNQGPTQ